MLLLQMLKVCRHNMEISRVSKHWESTGFVVYCMLSTRPDLEHIYLRHVDQRQSCITKNKSTLVHLQCATVVDMHEVLYLYDETHSIGSYRYVLTHFSKTLLNSS